MSECKECVKNVTCVERRYFGGNQKNCKQFIDLNQYVKVVRCKDCIHDNTIECPLCFIEKQTLQFINHDAKFFCGKGERKQDGK